MPQKALTSRGSKKPEKLGKKGPRVNSNWKKAIQKKGKFAFKPKSAGGTAQASREMTREVNLKNELEAARRATQRRTRPDRRVMDQRGGVTCNSCARNIAMG